MATQRRSRRNGNPRVSRTLEQAEQEGIARTTVVVPAGVHGDLVEALESRSPEY